MAVVACLTGFLFSLFGVLLNFFFAFSSLLQLLGVLVGGVFLLFNFVFEFETFQEFFNWSWGGSISFCQAQPKPQLNKVGLS